MKTNSRKNHRFLSRASIMAIALIAPSLGLAQQLDTIVVTATKRAENLQDVPISLLATSGEEVQDLALTNAADVTSFLPAVTITQNPIGNFVFIRGIGTPGANQGIEQSVSIFHDGVYMGRHQLSRAPFMDVDRIEVLKGPQSILFGKNTIGGAVHVIAAKPTDELSARASALFGSHGEVEFSGHISGPLTDRLRARISGRYYQINGYLDNVLINEDGPQRDDWTVRGQLEFDATETLTINAKWETSEFEQRQQSTQLSIINPFTPGAAAVSGLNQALVATATGGTGVEFLDDERAVANDGGVLLGQVAPIFAGLPGFPDLAERSDNSMDVGTLTIDWAIGGHTLTAITGFAQYDYRDVCDCDFAALPLIQVDATEDYEQFSQEIRLTSPTGGLFEYILGGYYQDSDLSFRSVESFGATLAFADVGVPTPLLVPNLTRDYVFNQDQEQWAIFGSLTWNITDRARLTGGLRYFDESKTADHILDKRFTGGWDYSALVLAPPGTILFGDTPADYDAFLASPFGATDLGGGVTPAFLTEAVYAGLLGTFEHNIVGRERNETNLDWSATAEYDFTDDILGYFTASTGTKGGGFDARFLRDNNNPFFEYEEETALAFEAGFKSTLLNGAMNLNVSGFYTEVEDFQVSIFDGATAFFVDNAAKVETMGVEADMQWAVTDNLTARFAGSWLDATFADFVGAPCWAGTVANNRGDCINRGLPTAFRDATGDTLPFAPELSFNASLDYRQELSSYLQGRVFANVYYSDSYLTTADLDPIYAFQPSFARVDVRASIGNIDDNWEIAFIGKNLTNEFVSGNNNDQPLVSGNGFAQTDRLRSFAVQATLKY